MSMVISKASGGRGPKERILDRKSLVSILYDGMIGTRVWMKWSRSSEIPSVGDRNYEPSEYPRPVDFEDFLSRIR